MQKPKPLVNLTQFEWNSVMQRLPRMSESVLTVRSASQQPICVLIRRRGGIGDVVSDDAPFCVEINSEPAAFDGTNRPVGVRWVLEAIVEGVHERRDVTDILRRSENLS